MHAGRKVALLCIDPWSETEGFHPFNFAVRRVQAALLEAGLDDVEVQLVEAHDGDADAIASRIEAIDPDVVGASAYVWSFAPFVDVAERIKRRRDDVTVVFGGPSARPAMFELEPYRDRRQVVDALVLGEGEGVFASIVAQSARDAQALEKVPGLALPSRDGFRKTTAASPIAELDQLASPYRRGLVSSTFSAHVESYRGCPLSCSFCQWGEAAGNSRIFSREYLTRELEAIRTLGLREALLVDAALNLNPRAFRNLAAAERDVRVLRDIGLHFEAYPSHMTDEHLAFLSGIRLRGIGLGLQSYDEDVLRRMQRPFDPARFERIARQLHELGGDVTIEIIMGLPGDTPESFMRTLDRARELPCNVRAYHCMVLPDALMTRAPSWAGMEFDPRTLLMRSCAGWSERELNETGERLTLLCDAADGWSQGTFWFFPSDNRRGFTGPKARANAPSPAIETAPTSEGPTPGGHEHIETLSAAAVAAVSSLVERATEGRLSLEAIERRDGVVVLIAKTRDGTREVELMPAREHEPAFRVVGSVSVSYRALDGAPPSGAFLEALDSLCTRASPLLARLVHGDRAAPPRTLPVVR